MNNFLSPFSSKIKDIDIILRYGMPDPRIEDMYKDLKICTQKYQKIYDDFQRFLTVYLKIPHRLLEPIFEMAVRSRIENKLKSMSDDDLAQRIRNMIQDIKESGEFSIDSFMPANINKPDNYTKMYVDVFKETVQEWLEHIEYPTEQQDQLIEAYSETMQIFLNLKSNGQL